MNTEVLEREIEYEKEWVSTTVPAQSLKQYEIHGWEFVEVSADPKFVVIRRKIKRGE